MLPQVPQGLPARVQPRACRNATRPRRPCEAGRVKSGMGKVTGFLEYHARELPLRRRSRSACNDWLEFVLPFPRRERRDAGRALHGLRRALLPSYRLPVNNLIPDWNDLVYRGHWRRAIARPALHQQFPGIHRPHLPGAVRSGLRAGHQRPSGHHQDDRMRDRRPRLRGRAGSSRRPLRTRPARRSRWSARARPAWPARSSSRAPATTCTVFEKHAKAGGLMRYGIPDFKMEKHHRRPPRRADGGRRRDLPLRRHVGHEPAGRRPRRRTSTRSC